jgi:hypothetical protein
VPRLGSQAWWAVYLFACLAMSVFIAFEVLDLDGSNLRRGLPRGVFAAETVRAETERLLHLTPAASAALSIRLASLLPLVRLVPSFSQAAGSPVPLHARPGAIRPRAHLQPATHAPAPASGDPA